MIGTGMARAPSRALLGRGKVKCEGKKRLAVLRVVLE